MARLDAIDIPITSITIGSVVLTGYALESWLYKRQVEKAELAKAAKRERRIAYNMSKRLKRAGW